MQLTEALATPFAFCAELFPVGQDVCQYKVRGIARHQDFQPKSISCYDLLFCVLVSPSVFGSIPDHAHCLYSLLLLDLQLLVHLHLSLPQPELLPPWSREIQMSLRRLSCALNWRPRTSGSASCTTRSSYSLLSSPRKSLGASSCCNHPHRYSYMITDLADLNMDINRAC